MDLSRESLGRRFVVAVLAGALAFLAPAAAGCQRQSQWALAAAAAVLLGAVALVARGLDRDARPRADPVMTALACLGGAWAIALVPLPAGLVGLVSPARMRIAREVAAAAGDGAPTWLPLTVCLECTRDAAALLVACACVFYAASRLLASGSRWRPVLGAVVASGSALAAWGMIDVLRAGGGRLTSTWVSANRFAGFMAIAGAAGVGLFIAEGAAGGGRRPRDRFGLPRGWWWLAGALACETALVLSLSRLGIASALVTALVALALFGRRTRGAVAALAGVLLLVAANACLAVGPVLGRYSLLFEGGRIGSGRTQCWAMAAPLALDFPVLGSGAGTFRHVFLMYQDPSLGGTWDYAHNDWLNVLTDGGAVSLAALGAAAILFYRSIVPLRSSRDPATRGVALAAFAALSVALLHSLGDYPLRQPANAILLALVCGVAWGRARAKQERSDAPAGPRAARWAMAFRAAGAVCLCASTVPLLVRLHLSGRLADAAERVAVGRDEKTSRPDLERRLGLLERAARLDPWDARVRYEAARTRVRLAMGSPDAAGARERLREAERELREARAVSPLDPRGYYLGAIIDWRPGATERADRMMMFALRLAPAMPDVTFQVGGYFLRRWLAEREEARGSFGLARLARGAEAEAGAAARDALFRRAAGALSLAARSDGARRDAVALALESGLSGDEIDALLAPDARTELALARGLAARSRHEEACPRYGRALASGDAGEPGHRVSASRAASLMALGRTAEALEQFAAALAGAPQAERERTVRRLGSIRATAGGAAALADFWAGRVLAGGDLEGEPPALLALGRAELAAGREREGFGHCLGYAERTGDAAAFAELAARALGRGDAGPAASLAARAAELEPARASHGMILARALVRLGDADGARAALGAVLARDPRNAAATRALAAVEAGASRHDAAVEAWGRFLDSGGDEAVAREALAGLYLSVLDRRRAAEELGKALEAKPGDERLRRKLEELRSAPTDGPRPR